MRWSGAVLTSLSPQPIHFDRFNDDWTKLDRLQRYIESGQYGRALELLKHDARLDQSYRPYLAQQQFLSFKPDELTPDKLEQTLALVDDPEWTASAALQTATTSNKPALVLKAVQVGQQAVALAINNIEDLAHLVENEDVDRVRELCSLDETVRKLCLIANNLIEVGDKTRTWQESWTARHAQARANNSQTQTRSAAAATNPFAVAAAANGEDAVATTTDDDGSQPADDTNVTTLSLTAFIAQSVSSLALELAASAETSLLCELCKRHSRALWPLRAELVNAVPEWQDPHSFAQLLTGVENGLEAAWRHAQPWRDTIDFIELVFSAGGVDDDGDAQDRRTAQELSSFYRERIEHVASLGLVSVALTFVQLCASLDVPDLEDLGEELSLLNRLAYDRPPPPDTTASQAPALPPLPLINVDNLTLSDWKQLAPADVLRAYLDGWPALDLPSAIRRLAVPYLSVLEARAERAGAPDATLSTRLLYDYILTLPSARLPRLEGLLAVFEASKPTLSAGSRIIKSDEDLARLALACVYGCRDNSAEAIVVMSKIFECLPVFDAKTISESKVNESSTSSKASLFALHPPGSDLPTPQYLFKQLKSFSLSKLTASIDALDLHLAEAETFSRYSVAVPLSWFLASHNDVKAQRAWATRMARTSSSGGGGKIGDEGTFEGEDEWEMLMEDMVSLTEGGDVDELRKAFWMLEKEEVLRIFFGGLLAASRITLAKSLLHPSHGEPPLPPHTVEELVIAASREFYDNAESGNMKHGDMKLAYECLAAAPQTADIRRQRDFIEATSRLCSYKLQSHAKADLTPIEIRLSNDRLSFVGRLLASNEDAYRHPDVILDLVAKLGYGNDKLAEIRTFAMISDSSLQAGDFERTAEICDRMVQAVEALRRERDEDKENEPTTMTTATATNTSSKARGVNIVQEASEFAWRNCFQLGKHEAFEDLDRRIKALGQALILCPSDRISQLLPVWTKLETDLAERSRQRAQLDKQKSLGGGGMLAGLGAPFSFGPTSASTQPSAQSSEPGVGGSPRQASSTMVTGVPTRADKPGVATRTINAFFGGGALRHATGAGGNSPGRKEHSPARTSSAMSNRGALTSEDESDGNMGSSPPSRSTSTGKRDRTNDDFGRLFGGNGDGHGQERQRGGERGEGFRAGISSRLTKGVGWLIGADEELERLDREREDML
ncbi:hypothetical protein ACM66B_000740 [Microbotryomycetes sp. NB124-2]